MNSRSFRLRLDSRCLPVAASLASCIAIGLTVTGCGSDNQEPVVAAPVYTPPPPAPEVPRVTPIRDLMAEMRIDDRIIFPEDRAPDNDPARRALLEFFDGFARGEANALRNMMDPLDRRELDAMVESNQWHEAVEGISTIEIIETGTAVGSGGRDGRGGAASAASQSALEELMKKGSGELRRLFESGEFRQVAGLTDAQFEQLQGMLGTPEFDQYLQDALLAMASMPAAASPALYAGEQCVLAMFTVDGKEQVQLWYYQPQGNGFKFQSAPTPPNMINQLSGTSWIRAWHDIIDRELMLASQPDERFTPLQRRLDDGDDSSTGPRDSGPSGPTGPRAPSAPPPPPVEVPTGPGPGGT